MSLKQKLKKLGPCLWELPKGAKPGMRVPAWLFLSERLLREVEDGAVEQAANVAFLPGIYKHSLAMPDMHFGYGFPIGGVAALDYEEGGLSPGGIGFDINCIAEDSEILTREGFKIKVKDFCKVMDKTKLITKNKNSSDFDHALFTVKRKREGRKIYRIVTNVGRELILSEEHPVFCTDGVKEAKKLKTGDEVIVYPFEGVEYEEKEGTILDFSDFEGCDKQIIEKLKACGLLPLTYSNPKIGILARVLGYVLGDGCIVKIREGKRERLITIVTGAKEDLELIREEISSLGFKPSKVYTRERVIKGENYYGEFVTKSSENWIRINSKTFSMLLNKLGIPVGRKTACEFSVPQWIKRAPLWIKRNFLAGFFGAEMSAPKCLIHRSYNFIQPIITVGKVKELKLNGYKFLVEIAELLKEFGVEINGIYEIPGSKNTLGIRLVISNRAESLIRLYTKIGFEYNRKRHILGMLVAHYLMLKEREIERRRKAVEIINELKGNYSLSRLVEIGEQLSVNKRFIERTLYESRENVRIGQDFFGFGEYLEEVKHKLGFSGFVAEKIERIEEVEYDAELYDLGVENNHNFIANGILVHNCGVRLLRTNLSEKQVRAKLKELLEELFRNVPSGVGRSGKLRLSKGELDEVLVAGAKWAVEHGYGRERDLEHLEEKGCLRYADAGKVSSKAKARGAPQLGTLGAGNHFLEIQSVEEIYLPDIARKFGIEKKGQVCVMIHTGSRGLGHQVCTDYLRVLEHAFRRELARLPDRELVYAPAGTKECEDYFAAMCAAANFAWCNRQLITHWTRESIVKVFGMKEEEIGLEIVYDVAHNIAKVEKHKINGETKKVYVHRKGATRAFGPGSEDIPRDYRDIGQPVLIPGSMGTASYVLIGTRMAEEQTFSSVCHGAGRVQSRASALRQLRGEKVARALQQRGILIRAASWRVVAEEAPQVYKDVDEVVRVCQEAGIARIVAKLRPIGVVKG